MATDMRGLGQAASVFTSRATGMARQFGSGTSRHHGHRASEARVRTLPLVNDLAHFLKVLKLPPGDSLRPF